MTKETYCQSCGMPLTKPEDLGTNADGSKNEEYCTYCYQNGAFTEDCTMDEMIEHNLKYNDETGEFGDRETAKEGLLEFMPTLKRWRKAD